MRHISFKHFYPLAFPADCLFPVCAPSATPTDEVSAVAAPASSGSGACSAIARMGLPAAPQSVADLAASFSFSCSVATPQPVAQRPTQETAQVRIQAGSSVDGIEVTELFSLPAAGSAVAVYEVLHGDKWLATRVARSADAAVKSVLRDCKLPGVSAYASALRSRDLKAFVRCA